MPPPAAAAAAVSHHEVGAPLKLKHMGFAVSDAQSESWTHIRTTPAEVQLAGGLSAHADVAAHAVEKDVRPQGGSTPMSCMCPQQMVPAGQSDGIEQPIVEVAGQVLAQAFLSVVRLAQQTWLAVHRVVVPASPQWAPRPASTGPASTSGPASIGGGSTSGPESMRGAPSKGPASSTPRVGNGRIARVLARRADFRGHRRVHLGHPDIAGGGVLHHWSTVAVAARVAARSVVSDAAQRDARSHGGDERTDTDHRKRAHFDDCTMRAQADNVVSRLQLRIGGKSQLIGQPPAFGLLGYGLTAPRLIRCARRTECFIRHASQLSSKSADLAPRAAICTRPFVPA